MDNSAIFSNEKKKTHTMKLNLVLVVVFVLESKGLHCNKYIFLFDSSGLANKIIHLENSTVNRDKREGEKQKSKPGEMYC